MVKTNDGAVVKFTQTVQNTSQYTAIKDDTIPQPYWAIHFEKSQFTTETQTKSLLDTSESYPQTSNHEIQGEKTSSSKYKEFSLKNNNNNNNPPLNG